MWKSVIRFDYRAANFQVRRPVPLLPGHRGSTFPSLTAIGNRLFSRDAFDRYGVPSGSDSVSLCGPNGEKISETAEGCCPSTHDRKNTNNAEYGQHNRQTCAASCSAVIEFPRQYPAGTHKGRLLDGSSHIGQGQYASSTFAIHPQLVQPVGAYACCDGSSVLERGDVPSDEKRANRRHGAVPIVSTVAAWQRSPISIVGNCNGYMPGCPPSRRCFALWSRSGNNNKDTAGSASSRGSAVTSWTKGRSLTRGLMSLSYHLVRWAVVLPFRLGKWTIHLVSLTFKAVGHLMSMCARAAVVARVGGVSGIFKSIVGGIKHTVHWCKTGFRLYFANVKVSYYILLKRLKGHPMRYNERKLLMNTLNDALKLVPFSFFLIVPFAELLLPVAIRLFPQMLPSTFRTDNSKSDDYLQKKLLAKKELAQFFQELVQERTNQLLQDELDSSIKTKMEALKDFQERILNKKDRDINPFLSSNELLVFAKIFKKEFKLDQMNLETLKVMCKLLGITPFSVRSHVVLQLRHHLLKIQREDRLIMWEGVDSLSTEELQEACRDRAMKFYNISREQLQQQLKQWLDLSSMPQISPILLLWSRCITMTHEPMAIKADDEIIADDKLAIPETAAVEVADVSDAVHDVTKPTKVGEKFAEEVTTAQKASSTRIMKAVTAAAEVDAQKLVSKEERLEELSLKAKELKDIIDGNVKPCEGEELVDGVTSLDDPMPGELLELHSSEENFMHLHNEDHVIRHAEEIKHLSSLGKKEILVRHEELLSALHIQREITDLQHNQLTEMYAFLLKVSEDLNAGVESNIKDAVNDLVLAARQELEKIEELTCQFDKHNLTYESQTSTPAPVSSTA
ncbi:LETM1 family protein [Babesia ovata]|uniref:LETM1 family protein n=1 Tax=Babesia ovata TaxID=189622 RepID=A0A2H6KET4_9APIC|nr:LETM1 family protein [Babesia ovata]GBE61484.1 LETM1 family protein [Babesia ovata]